MKVNQAGPYLPAVVYGSQMEYGLMYRGVDVPGGHNGKIFLRVYDKDGLKVFLLENTKKTWGDNCAANWKFERLRDGEKVELVQAEVDKP